MNPALTDYIKRKREAGLGDDKIQENLIAQDWPANQVAKAMALDVDNDAPPPPAQATPVVSVTPSPNQNITPVVNTFTTRGIEYVIMFISLWVMASSIGILLHELVNSAFKTSNGGFDSFSLIGPATSASLIVALPIFAVLFLRLKKAEQEDVSVRQDHSRKRAINITLVVTFLVGISKVIGTIYQLISGGGVGGLYGAATDFNPLAEVLHLIITLGIAGSIFIYYWRDLHKSEQQ